MKVFLNTNVLVSAVATRGLCADLLREVLNSHQIVISPSLLKELESVLREKIGVPEAEISVYIDLLIQDAVSADPTVDLEINIKDLGDIKVLTAAVLGGAELFVTGEKELIDLGEIQSLHIVSPRIFWERLQSGF